MEQGVPPSSVAGHVGPTVYPAVAQILSERDIAEGYTLLIPRGFHMTLTVLANVFTAIVVIPSWFLFKNAIAFLVGLLVPVGMVAGILAAMAVGRRRTRRVISHLPGFFLAQAGWDVIVGWLAVIAAATSLAFGGLLVQALASCPTKTVESLCTMTCSDLVVTNTTDWSTVETVPGFSTNIIWQNICIGDYALSIVAAILGFMCTVLMVVVAFYAFRLRASSKHLLLERRMEPRKRLLSTKGPSLGGDVPLDMGYADSPRRPVPSLQPSGGRANYVWLNESKQVKVQYLPGSMRPRS